MGKIICPICGGEVKLNHFLPSFEQKGGFLNRAFRFKCTKCGTQSESNTIKVNINETGNVVVDRTDFDKMVEQWCKYMEGKDEIQF